MQQNKKFLRVLCSLLAAALAAWCTVLLCRWVGYDLQERLGNTPSYEIINDDYSQIIDIHADGLTQAMPLKAGQPFYGVRFKFSTHGQLYKSGMTMVEAYNEAGEQILFAAGNFLNIWDDTFTEFTCNEAYIPDHDETLTIRLYNESAWDGPLGVWASEGEVSGMPLSVTDGDTLNATMAMQRVSDFTGSWPAALAARLQKPLAAAVFIAVLLAMLHAPLYLFVPVVGLALGVTFTYVTPALVAPDEYTHLAAAYELASTWSGQTAADEDGNLLLRECDAAHFGTKTGDIGVLAYKNEAIAETSEPGSPDVLTTHSEVKAGQGSGSYLAQALGIRLARAQGKNFYTMLLYGRLANLILYLLLAALAVWLAPTSLRGLFACVALLPMPLQLAASLSPDAAVLGLVFSFTALCLRLRGEKAVWWQKILLIVLGGLTAPGKAIYLPVILLCLLIPAENLTYDGNPTVKFLGEELPGGCCIHAATLVLAFCFWLAANLNAVAYAARDMNTTVLVTAAAAAAVLLVLALAAYLKLHKRPKLFFWCKVAFAAVLVVGAVGGVYAVSHMGGGLDPDQPQRGLHLDLLIWLYLSQHSGHRQAAAAHPAGTGRSLAARSAGHYPGGAHRLPHRCQLAAGRRPAAGCAGRRPAPAGRTGPAGPPQQSGHGGHLSLRCAGCAGCRAELDPHQLPDALRLAGALPAADFAAGPAAGKKQQKAGPARGCLPHRGALHQHFNHVDPAARLWPVRRLAAGIIK